MCGIDGFFSTKTKLVIGTKYYDAHLLLKHRGPNDEGFIANTISGLQQFCGDDTNEAKKYLNHITTVATSNLVFGHRRLSIIDLSDKGHQPMIDEDQRYTMVYNGEVYNYKEIRTELEKKGLHFESESDSEVVFKAIIAWGMDALNKFNGMWAIAFYDNLQQTLLLSRDRFGIKPLYYSIYNGCIFFASEIKFIKKFCDKKYEINFKSVEQYIEKSLINCNGETFWEGIEEIAPGSILIFDANGVKKKNYWQLKSQKAIFNLEDAIKQFGKLFQDSLEKRMISDVKVGATLSGGLDSNLIVAELFNMGYVNKKSFDVFSIVFKDERYSEKKYIDQTLKKIGLEGHYIYPSIENFIKDIDKMIYYLEIPCKSFSTYSLYSLYKYISENSDVKVILNGQGADEVFAGYTGHYFLYFAELLKQGKMKQIFSEMKIFKDNRNYNWCTAIFYTIYNYVKMLLKNSNFEIELLEGIGKGSLREYLCYDDRLSMAFGIETRAAFMDYRLIEFGFQLGKELKINKFANKVVPRGYAKNRVEPLIVDRLDKMGFISPQEQWQKKELCSYINNNLEGLSEKIIKNKWSGKIKKYKGKKSTELEWNKAWRIACFNRWLEVNAVEERI